jgi:hypothetical protein
MMCICGNVLPANAEECPACGGSFNPNSRPIPAPGPTAVSACTLESKPGFDPAITVSLIIFVLTVLIGVAFQSLA